MRLDLPLRLRSIASLEPWHGLENLEKEACATPIVFRSRRAYVQVFVQKLGVDFNYGGDGYLPLTLTSWRARARAGCGPKGQCGPAG